MSAAIGFLSLGSPEGEATFVTAFRKGLSEGGYTEGRNVAIEFRWAEGHYDRLPALAEDLVNRKVEVIATIGMPRSALSLLSGTARTVRAPSSSTSARAIGAPER